MAVGSNMHLEPDFYGEDRMEEFLTTEEAAALLRLAPQTLNRRRCEGSPPIYHKIGRRCLYRREDLEAFVSAARRTSTSDPGPTIEIRAPGKV